MKVSGVTVRASDDCFRNYPCPQPLKRPAIGTFFDGVPRNVPGGNLGPRQWDGGRGAISINHDYQQSTFNSADAVDAALSIVPAC